jgi:hypothetical protein
MRTIALALQSCALGALVALGACTVAAPDDDSDSNRRDAIDGAEDGSIGGPTTGAGTDSSHGNNDGASGSGTPTTGDDGSNGGPTTGSSTGDDNNTGCTYPAGPYGVGTGDVLPPNLSWQGRLPGAADTVTMTAQDLFDCDGSKGINAVLLTTSQFGCGACYQESSALEQRMAAWQTKGIHAAVLLVDDQQDGPPNLAGVDTWISSFDFQTVGVYMDPYYSLVEGNTVGTPQNSVIDPRTMKVTFVQQGYAGNYPQLEAVAAQNSN